MKLVQFLGALLGLVMFAPTAVAEIQPSFDAERCAWGATHIVVGTEGHKIDGVFEVLASWKGGLRKGESITVPELAAMAADKEREVAQPLFGQDVRPRLQVTATRTVLFLVKDLGKRGKGRDGIVWKPASFWDEMKVSAAWIEGGQVFAFVQQDNPGPRELIRYGMTEKKLRDCVGVVLRVQTGLKEATAKPDGTQVEAAIARLLKTESRFLRPRIVTSLRDAGPNAVPALRSILRDDALAHHHHEALYSLAKAGRATVAPELIRVVTDERAFWKKTGPGLPLGWWNGSQGAITWEEVDRLRYRYGRVQAALEGLLAIRPPDCRQAVTDFRDYWRSLPQLAEIVQLGELCDIVLAALPQK